MPSVPPADQPSENLAIVVVGNDALIEALPARPIQFAHACRAAGFDLVLPESWGDELVAEATLRAVEARGGHPAVFCACPIVRQRLLASGLELASLLVNTAAPPVAVARYVRAWYGTRVGKLVYIGECPAADAPDYDARHRTAEFLAEIAAKGIDVLSQPTVFDAVIPPDRRRFSSLPGGCPTPELLWERANQQALIALPHGGDEFAIELAQQLLARQSVLIDVAPALGCFCSGATAKTPGPNARIAVMSLEPPRARNPVLEPAPEEDLMEPVRRPPPPGGSPTNPQARTHGLLSGGGPGGSRPPIAITPPQALSVVPHGSSRHAARGAAVSSAVQIRWSSVQRGIASAGEPAGADIEQEPAVSRSLASPTAPARPLRPTRPTSGSVPTVTLADPASFRVPRAYLTRRPVRRRPSSADAPVSDVGKPAQTVAARERAEPLEGEPVSGLGAPVAEPTPPPAQEPLRPSPPVTARPVQPASGQPSRRPVLIRRAVLALLAAALLFALLRWLLSS